MHLQDELKFEQIFIQQLHDKSLDDFAIKLDVLRLDKIHPVVSGNKWFKLKYWLRHAIEKNYTNIATFGGAFSNHIIATAYACNKHNLNCTGFIRGEEPERYSQTLKDAKALNMQLNFLSRTKYAGKQNVIQNNTGLFFIPEGGYGNLGAKGASEILQLVPNVSAYDYIICAVGTGTMLAGITNASLPHQQLIGISVMKNNIDLENEISFLLNAEASNRIKILHDYHFGGYAKYNNQLIDFMNSVWLKHKLPLDFVYNAKTLFAVYDLVAKGDFGKNKKLLFIHSGGLQGNSSLQKNTLLYS